MHRDSSDFTGEQEHRTGEITGQKPPGNTSSGVPQEYTHIAKTHKGRRTLDSEGEKHDGKGALDLGFRDNGKA